MSSSTDVTPRIPDEPSGRDARHAPGRAMEIWGHCPKCREWFACHTWFDRSVPTPTCPPCGLLPGALRYERPDVPRDAKQRIVSELWLG